MNHSVNKPARVIANNIDERWSNNTIFNHFNSPKEFAKAMIDSREHTNHNEESLAQLNAGIKALDKAKTPSTSNLYKDVHTKVKSALIARGFTSQLLYGDVGFTTKKTGALSKQRVMLGRRDCYYKDTSMDDGKLFHDIYINLSYRYSISDSTIEQNSLALYSLVKELARLIPIRIFVINHVNTSPATCYSYCLKKFGTPISPKEFHFFTSDSKRTFGWSSYELLSPGYSTSTVGEPTNTISIADFNLDETIDSIWTKLKKHKRV